MEPFSLEKYLENQSRKIVTRDGRPVRIICTDRKARSGNIVGLVSEDESSIYVWQNDGTHAVSGIDTNDLFFADKEEELTEFESKLFSTFSEIWQDYMLGREIDVAQVVKEYSPELLDLARKELGLVDNTCGEYALNEAYKQGKQDALKDLPKWKKANKETDFEERVLIYEDDYICYDDHVYIDDYYIERNELKKLPKEE